MVHVSIQHIIGTVALIALTISLALAYQIVVSYVEENVIRAQLSQTAEYVSMSIAHIISLTEFTYGMLETTIPATKLLNLPETIRGRAYNLTIVEKNGKYYVQLNIIGRSDFQSSSLIPTGSTQMIVIYVGGSLPNDLVEALNEANIKPKTWVYGGSPNAVLWCYKLGKGEPIYVGLGLLEGG